MEPETSDMVVKHANHYTAGPISYFTNALLTPLGKLPGVVIYLENSGPMNKL